MRMSFAKVFLNEGIFRLKLIELRKEILKALLCEVAINIIWNEVLPSVIDKKLENREGYVRFRKGIEDKRTSAARLDRLNITLKS